MNSYSEKETLYRLSQPDGPARIDLDQAWESLVSLSLQGDPKALGAMVRAVREKKYREKAEPLFSPDVLKTLISSENAKTRKNTARLIGQFGKESDAFILIEALSKESIRMVRPSMILALGAVGGEKAEDYLLSYQVSPASDASEESHVKEERQALDSARIKFIHVPRHAVRGLPKGMRIELTTSEHLEEAVLTEMKAAGLEASKAAAGRIRTELVSYKTLCHVRAWREMLIPVFSVKAPADLWPKIIADRAGRRIYNLLDQIYEGEAPYTYRIEIRADFENLNQKIRGSKKLSRADMARELNIYLNKECGDGKLLNHPSDYETELRLEAHGEGVIVYLKLCTLPDHRFDYRKETVAASIHPSAAAAVMAYAAPYLKPGAAVYDPCCGSGTMLIERALFDETKSLIGTDISQEALDKAAINLKSAHLSGRFILKNCLLFKSQEKVDEVISNLPFGHRTGDHETNEALYDGLLKKLPLWLKKDGIAVFYTMELKLMEQMLKKHQNELSLLQQVRTEAGGLKPGIFIIGLKQDERQKETHKI